MHVRRVMVMSVCSSRLVSTLTCKHHRHYSARTSALKPNATVQHSVADTARTGMVCNWTCTACTHVYARPRHRSCHCDERTEHALAVVSDCRPRRSSAHGGSSRGWLYISLPPAQRSRCGVTHRSICARACTHVRALRCAGSLRGARTGACQGGAGPRGRGAPSGWRRL